MERRGLLPAGQRFYQSIREGSVEEEAITGFGRITRTIASDCVHTRVPSVSGIEMGSAGSRPWRSSGAHGGG